MPRPPQSDAGSVEPHGKSADFLRRRLAQAEMQLREMESESKRVAAQQQRTVDAVRHENIDYLEKIEQLRMDECVENLDTSEGMAAAKILASKCDKYCKARDLVSQRRSECAEAEAQLADARQQLVELRRRYRAVKRKVSRAAVAATTELSLQNRSSENSRDQLRNLEGRIIAERERLGLMIVTAKNVREEIDGCLIEQARYEKNYAKRLAQLLEKLKELSYVVEICEVIFEERDHQAWELREVQRISEQERDQYEHAFSEIAAVVDENKRQLHENESRNTEIRNSINETKVERMALEAKIQEVRKSLQKQFQQKDDDSAPQEDQDDIMARIKEYKLIFDALADVADVETINEVVSFPRDLGEKRFSTFKELNHLDESIKCLEMEKKDLIDAFTSLSNQVPEDAERVARMKELREKVEQNKREIEQEKEHLANTTGAINAICSDLETIFTGLDCNWDLIKEKTGMSSILPNSALTVFCIAEQRAQEYLLLLSKRHSADSATKVAGYAAAQANEQVANTIVRRQDLHPRKSVSVVKQLRHRELPRTTDTVSGHSVPDGIQDDRPLSLDEMRAIALRRARTPLPSGNRRDKSMAG